MYECPNCAGNLKFDIVRQQLYCEYCGTQVDPYSFYKEKDAQETKTYSEDGEETYEVTVFTCPQCGARIVSEDTTAATFCSFCTASTILDSRIGKERRPVSIIPFTKTKEDCRAAYGKMLRRAFFAPKELKDENLIEKFRGIYMPYWVYSFEKEGPVTFPGSKTHRRGDYLVTDHYQIDCQVEEKYEGLAYDASSTFSDSLSKAIAPFDMRKGKAFVPAFLSGFYGDTSDVKQYVYLSEAEKVVLEDAGNCLARNPVCKKYHAGQGEGQYAFQNALRPSKRKVQLAMLPVWFLSYRNGDRVSYAVVNGQTGKAAADLPVDGKRYLAGSLILAVPLFILLNLFLTVTPGKILVIAALLALLCMFISNRQLSYIFARESGEEDKGLASVKPSGSSGYGWNRRGQRQGWWHSNGGKVVLMIFLFYGTAFLPGILLRMVRGMPGGEGMRSGSGLMMLNFLVVVLIGWAISFAWRILEGSAKGGRKPGKVFGGGYYKEKWPVLRKPLMGIGTAVLILLLDPVSDWFYYIGALICMGTILWAIMDIIKQHNMLATRKLPQLGRRGGDEFE